MCRKTGLRMGVVTKAFPAQANTILGYHDSPAYNRGVLMDRAAILADCEKKMATFDVRPPNRAAAASRRFPAATCSRSSCSRAKIGCDPRVLLVGQPTRGVDIGAIEFISPATGSRCATPARRCCWSRWNSTKSCGLADRILVMAGGEIVGELSRAEATEEKIGLMMAGVKGEGRA